MDIDKIFREALIPSRTKYQIRNFVLNKHDTPIMQARQLLIEGQNLSEAIETVRLQQEINEIKKRKLEESDDPIDHIEAKKLEIVIRQNDRVIKTAEYEMDYLRSLVEDMPEYSLEAAEADQEDYWRKRLTRQANTERLATYFGLGAGNIESMIASGMTRQAIEGTIVDAD